MIESKILFRPSEVSGIMPNGKGKSNIQKYEEAIESKTQLAIDYNLIKNKETKTAKALWERRKKNLKTIHDLHATKHLPNLSEGVKTLLRGKMIEILYKRYKANIGNKYTTKGLDCEESGITLYSILKGKVFENNKERVTNDYFSGEIDLAWTNDKGEVYKITDIKNSYSIHTFFDNLEDIKKANYWQGVAYMHLHKTALEYSIANVLVDNTPDAILLDMHRESYKWQDGDTPAWRELEILKDHVYTDVAFNEFVNNRGINPTDEKSQKMYDSFVEIPMEQRLIEHTFERDETEIEALTTRIDECRLYMEIIYGIKHV